MKSQFTIIVERDPESGWLVGEVAELPGCYTQEHAGSGKSVPYDA